MDFSTHRFDEVDHVGYDPTTDTYHNQCNLADTDSLSVAIVETVSAINGQEPTEMEPLYSVLDPDALESLLSTGGDSYVQVSFAFGGCIVSVTGNGEIAVKPEK